MATLSFVLKVFGCVWLMVTLLSALVRLAAPGLPLPAQTFLVCAVVVPSMVWLILPAIRRLESRGRA